MYFCLRQNFGFVDLLILTPALILFFLNLLNNIYLALKAFPFAHVYARIIFMLCAVSQTLVKSPAFRAPVKILFHFLSHAFVCEIFLEKSVNHSHSITNVD